MFYLWVINSMNHPVNLNGGRVLRRLRPELAIDMLDGGLATVGPASTTVAVLDERLSG